MRGYAVRERDGKRLLVEIRCDGCGDTIKPNPDIARSGWTKRGQKIPGVGTVENEYCPDCS